MSTLRANLKTVNQEERLQNLKEHFKNPHEKLSEIPDKPIKKP